MPRSIPSTSGESVMASGRGALLQLLAFRCHVFPGGVEVVAPEMAISHVPVFGFLDILFSLLRVEKVPKFLISILSP